MANIFTDTFVEAGGSNVNLSAHTATPGGGTWALISGYSEGAVVVPSTDDCHPYGSALGIYYTSATPSSADYQVTADMTYTSGSSDDKDVGLTVRQNTGAVTMYLFRRTGGGAGTWDLYRLVAGSGTLIAGPYTQSLTNGQTYAMFLSASGTGGTVTVTATIDGVHLSGSPYPDTDGTRITSTGRAGLWMLGSLASQKNTLDNYSADDIAAGTPSTSKNLLLLGVG